MRKILIPAAVLFLSLATFFVAEAAVRLFGPAAPAPLERPESPYPAGFLEENARPFFRVETRDGVDWLIQQPTVYKNDLRQAFRAQKRPGVSRILVVGESSADMLGHTLTRLLAYEIDRFEVMNMSVGGGDLRMVAHRLREGMRYGPDVVVLLFGNNVRFHHPPFPGLFRFGCRLFRSKVIRLLLGRLRFAPRTVGPDIARYERFLAEAAAMARRNGARLVVCTVPSELLFPPRMNQPAVERKYDDARYLEAAGRRREAIECLERFPPHSRSALWHFTRGEWLYLNGNFQEAREALERARTMDPGYARADRVLNDMIRAKAAAEGFDALDLAALVDGLSPRGIPGFDVFTDGQHVRDEVKVLEARELFRLFGRLAWPSAETAWPVAVTGKEPHVAPAWARPVNSLAHRAKALSDDEAMRQAFWVVLERGMTPRPEQLMDYAGSGFFGENLAVTRVRALLLVQFGRALIDFGRAAEAMAYFAPAAALAPEWEGPAEGRALAALALGRRDEAANWLRKALSLNPGREDLASYLQKLRAGAP